MVAIRYPNGKSYNSPKQAKAQKQAKQSHTVIAE